MILNESIRQPAILQVLYLEQPTPLNNCFIQIRQWETADENSSDLIMEYGHVDKSGELNTQCKVLPFYMTVREALAEIVI